RVSHLPQDKGTRMHTRFIRVWQSLLCSTLAILFIPSSAALAATYYVSPSGSDLNPGTQASPWQTLQMAADTMVAGDKVLIADGNYAGGVPARNIGTAAAPVIFQAIHPGGAVILGDAIANIDEFNISHAQYVIVDGLTVRNGSRGIRIDNSFNCTVRRCS